MCSGVQGVSQTHHYQMAPPAGPGGNKASSGDSQQGTHRALELGC